MIATKHKNYLVPGLFDSKEYIWEEIQYYLRAFGIERPVEELMRYEKELLQEWKKGNKFYFEFMYNLPVRLKNRFHKKKVKGKYVRNYDQETNRRIVREYSRKGVQISNREADKIRIERNEKVITLKSAKKKEKLSVDKKYIKVDVAKKKLEEYVTNEKSGVYVYDIENNEIKRYDDLYAAAFNIRSSKQSVYNASKRNQVVKKNYIVKVVK